ncbi:MAG: hypothetical protein QOK19_2903 [Solirubrobacteraceae bacterium]|nr:hypothetical protein [Solirubrobacteraceae bacterium]
MSRALDTRLHRAAATIALVALAACGLGASGASAYLHGHSSGSGQGQVTSLSAPAISTASAATGTVALSWEAVTPPGSGSVSYYVRRDGGTPGGNCPSASSPASGTSCTDGGLGPGSHVYTVTALWRSWTQRGAERSVTVAVGVADHLLLSAGTATPTAGSTDSLTVTAKDSAGSTVPTYSGSKSLTFAGASTIGSNHPTVTNSSGSPVSFGTAEPITFTNGVAAASGSKNGVMTLYKAETASVTVTDGTLGNGSGTSITVAPASTSVFSLATPATQTAGTAFEETIAAFDSYGNATSSYSGPKSLTFSGPASSPGAKSPSYPSTVTFTAGVGTASVTLYDAQTTTLTAKQSFTASGTSASFAVAPAAASALGVANPGGQTAGTPFNATLTAIDAYGNTQPSYAGTKAVTFSGPTTSPTGKAPLYAETVTFNGGVGSAAVTLYNAQSANLKASDGTFSGTSTSFTVAGAAAATFTLSTPAPTAGSTFSETITAKDLYGNTATGYTGSKAITFSGPGNSPGGKAPSYPSTVSFSSGSGTTSSPTIYDAGTMTLTATQGTITGTSASFTVAPAGASAFAWEALSTQTAGTAFSATLTADDAYGNVANYQGTKTLTFGGAKSSPGGKAPSYPASVIFTAGTGTANNITLYDADSAVVLTATQSTVQGSSAAFQVSSSAAASLSLPAPSERTAGSAFNETITALDTYGNTATGYEGAKSLTFSGPSSSPGGKAPAYPSSVTFTAGAGTASISLYNAQATTLAAADGTLSGTSSSFIVGPAGASSFTLATPAPTAGTSFGEGITAKDLYGNTATGYTGSKTIAFSGPASSPGGKAPSYPSSVSFTSGVATASPVILYNAGSTTLTATQGTITGTSAGFTVKASVTGSFTVSNPGAQTAGTAFAVTLTAGPDAYGNAVAPEGAQTITFSGPEASPSEKAPSYPASVTFTGNSATVSVTLFDAATAVTLSATQGTAKGTSTSFAVNAGAAARLAWENVTGNGSQESATCLFTCTWSGLGSGKKWNAKVGVTDVNGNLLTNLGGSHVVELSKTLSGSALSASTLTVSATNEAVTSTEAYTSATGSWTSDTLTAKSSGYTEAIATLKK